MANLYVIRKAGDDKVSPDHILTLADKAEIEYYPWDKNGYMPKTEARAVFTEKGFHLLLISHENEILASRKNMNDPVCRDSCMEFFFNPDPENNNKYFNFEFNPLGTLYLGVGKSRLEHMKIADTAPEMFRIRPSIFTNSAENFSSQIWSIQFFIPFGFIEKYFGKLKFGSGMNMTGNFYKCAEDTKHPHFGCWNKITSDVPDFHRPECFGNLILE